MRALTGYTDRLSARPGEPIALMLSSAAAAPVSIRLVRVICGDPNPDGPGLIEEDLGDLLSAEVPSRVQQHSVGSYGEAPMPPMPGGAVTLTAIVWPTLPGAGAETVLSTLGAEGGLALGLGPDGAVRGRLALGETVTEVTTPAPLTPRRWWRIWVSHDPATGELIAGHEAVHPRLGRRPDGLGRAAAGPGTPAWPAKLTIAARAGTQTSEHFSGKIEAPAILGGFFESAPRADEPVAHWDFSRGIGTAEIVDVGPFGCHGRLYNTPARAMTGARWSGREMCWRAAPEEWGAVHFHPTDLTDCGWEPDITLTVPDALPSGVYGFRVTAGDATDLLPLFVPPPKGTRGADLCVLIPTFTYVVYGNFDRPDFGPAYRERAAELGMAEDFPGDHPEYGLSTYNRHADGSGVAYASHLRPMLTVRPGAMGYLDPVGSGLRHFPADTHLLAWLAKEGLAFDVVTDHDLHAEGAGLITPYRCLLTATHPEYHTTETLDALTAFRDGGGRFCYLGGNGFYWRVGLSEAHPGVVEIRRAEGGIRAWEAQPGEYFHAFDGAYGGLWRRSGRAPQALAGVGFSAQGPFAGSHYRRVAAAKDARVAWMFEGVPEGPIGDFGLSGGGAAGFELDRADARLGTPAHALVVARSEDHGAGFMAVPEEQLTHIVTLSGEALEDLIRAELVFFETPAGGAVFSTGSITFCGSLPSRDFDNPVSRLLGNVVRRFLDPMPFEMPDEVSGAPAARS